MRSDAAVTTGSPGATEAARRPDRPLGAAAVVAVAVLGLTALLAGCGAGAPAAEGGDLAASTAPGADDPSLPTLDPPEQSVLDAAAARTSDGPSTAVGADGLALTVLSAACGLPGVRSDGYAAAAQGQACLVQVQVVNLTAEQHDFSPDRTALLVSEGGAPGEPVPPSAAAMALPAAVGMEAQLPPATTLTGTIVYDVPVGATATEVTLDQGRAVLP